MRTADRHGIRRYTTAPIAEILPKALNQRCAAAARCSVARAAKNLGWYAQLGLPEGEDHGGQGSRRYNLEPSVARANSAAFE